MTKDELKAWLNNAATEALDMIGENPWLALAFVAVFFLGVWVG